MSIALQSEQDRALDEDVCSYCERVYVVADGHTCNRRYALHVHARSTATSHTRPTDASGKMLFGPAKTVLAEESEERAKARRIRAREFGDDE